MIASHARSKRVLSEKNVYIRSELETSHEDVELYVFTSPCISSRPVRQKIRPTPRWRRRSAQRKLLLAISTLVVAACCSQIISAHAFSWQDMNIQLARVRQLRSPLSRCKRSDLAASPSSSSTESDISSSPLAETAASLPSRRNWRICTRSIIEAATACGSAASDHAVISPFEQKAYEDEEGSNPQDAVSVLEPSAWSPEAYQSALELYDRLMEYCNAYKSESDDEAIGPNENNLPRLILSALDILHQAYRLYGPQSVVGSYNGGKDACVILHLMRAAYANYIRDNPKLVDSACQPKTIYFEHADEFQEVLDLVHETVVEYDLNMLAFEKGIKFPDGLRSIVETNYIGEKKTGALSKPFPIAFVLGTRAGDPNAGNQGAFAPSSSFMPPFMRVNPILTPEWTYADVWEFLRRFDLKYCRLYDEGYTSLGTTKDTLPCPALKKDDLDLSWEEDTGNALHDGGEECNGEYWPAYMLKEWDQERAGRIKAKK